MGEQAGPSPVEQCPGYKSPEARRTYLIAAGIIGAVALALQVLLRSGPNGLPGLPAQPSWELRLEYVHAETAVRWKGDLWYAASEIRSGFEGADQHTANRLVHLAAEGPATVCSLAPGQVWLLALPDALWTFSGDGVAQYDGKEVRNVSAKALESASQPFLLGGLPAVVEGQSPALRVVVLENGAWTEKARLELGGAKEPVPGEAIKVAMVGDKPYVFCPQGDTLYCREGFPDKDVRFPADWEKVGPSSPVWTVAAIGDGPAAFMVQTETDKFASTIVGLARSVTKVQEKSRIEWQPIFTRASAFPPPSVGVVPDAGHGVPLMNPGYSVLYQPLQWSPLHVAGGGSGQGSLAQYGGLTRADRDKAVMLFVPFAISGALTVALAFALSRLMAAYRGVSYSGPGWPGNRAEDRSAEALTEHNLATGHVPGSLEWASVIRRGFALMIDLAIVLGPLMAGVAGTFWVLPGADEHVNPRALAVLSALVLGGAIWALAAFLIFCYSTGRWGRTPGKWAMGVRVMGLEMAPCGFARALLRSLLLFVDGFVAFTFGVLVIALMTNRQRTGDLAARTIVIRERHEAASVRPLDTEI